MSALLMRSKKNLPKSASVRRTYSQETTESAVVSHKSSVGSQKSELAKVPQKFNLESLKQAYTDCGCNHLIPLFLLIGYTLLGGWIYYLIEHDEEILQKSTELKEQQDRIATFRRDLYLNLEAVIMNPSTTNWNKLNYTKMVIVWYEEQLNISSDATVTTYNWDIWNAMFFASTIFTTIGYGSFAPGTASGQIFTIFYAIFGIPLVLAILNDLGQVLCRKANGIWSHFQRGNKSEVKDGRSEAEKRADAEHSIPATLAIFLTLFWLFGCSALFLLWETDWSYLKSFYFFFISLSTIGLGDVTFSNPKMMLANFPLVLIGLSLVSMCFNVIQLKIEEFVYGLIHKFQDEYEKLSADLQENLTAEERDVILKEVWAKQPLLVRTILPVVMSEKHHQQLLSNCTKISQIGFSNSQVQTDTNAKDSQTVQTELDVDEFNQQTDIVSVMQRSMQAVSAMQECDMQTSSSNLLSRSVQIEIPMEEFVMQTSMISDNNSLADLSMQTSFDTQSAQMQTSTMCSFDVSCQSDFIPLDCEDTEDSGMQAGESFWQLNDLACQTNEPTTIDLIMQTSPIANTSCIDKVMQTSPNHPAFYNGTSCESVESADVICQTDESYLAKANKLEALRLRKTDSLNIMCATPFHKEKRLEK